MHVLSTCSRLGASSAVGFNLYNPGTQSIPRRKERKEGTCPRQVGEKEGLHQTGVDRRTRQRQRSTDRREGRTQSKRRNNKECAFFYLLARA